MAFVEINNENALFSQWSWGQLDDLPEPYAATFRQIWNAWLRKKYADTAAAPPRVEDHRPAAGCGDDRHAATSPAPCPVTGNWKPTTRRRPTAPLHRADRTGAAS